ncbi:uncharacterized protein LOC142106691 [Mixophyes fleayi]|uniref:uncharacterized protein LOC142106691 n=1 Tax=Mixophyes fleayi TaxID=3061075 RepID=UPI003F4D7EFB
MLLGLAKSLALTLMVCVIVTNWLVVTTTVTSYHRNTELGGGTEPVGDCSLLWSETSRRLVTVAVSGVALTVPEVYVLLRPSSSRFCSQPLLDNLICNIGFTLFTTAFSLILVLLDPLPRWLRVLFHTFGAASFVEGICTVLTTSLARECAVNTPALYCLSVVFSALNILSTGFFLLVGPFWLLNARCPGMVLNKQSRTGICYEPVTCCPCVWHV